MRCGTAYPPQLAGDACLHLCTALACVWVGASWGKYGGEIYTRVPVSCIAVSLAVASSPRAASMKLLAVAGCQEIELRPLRGGSGGGNDIFGSTIVISPPLRFFLPFLSKLSENGVCIRPLLEPKLSYPRYRIYYRMVRYSTTMTMIFLTWRVTDRPISRVHIVRR